MLQSKHNLKPEVIFCKKHKSLSKSSISLDRVLGISENDNMARLLFDKFKCTMCSKLPTMPQKCPDCSRMYCRDCLVFQSQPISSLLASDSASCQSCQYSFSNFEYSLTSNDHFKLKQDACLPQNRIYQIDRNLKQIIVHDLKVKCIYHEYEECERKEGDFECIVKH